MDYQRKKSKSFFAKIFKAAIVIAVLYFIFTFFFKDKFEVSFVDTENKKIFLELDGNKFEKISNAKTVGEFLEEIKLPITENDYAYPNNDQKIYSGSSIYVKKARKIVVSEAGEEKEFYTLKTFVGEAVREKQELKVGEYDIIEPGENSYVEEGLEISITHVKVETEMKEESVVFKTVENEDDNLGWREKKITQKGEKGIKEVSYEVVYHDGKEIKRKKTGEKITKEPVSEIIMQGTFVKLGKTHTGLGTWYTQPKHLESRYPSISGFYAANPWLPMGSYAKVTNKANGKSVIVRINDRGPFGENRIIDLGKPAFSAIASIGAGVVDTKVEEIKN